jgi:hypothetical protein
VAWPMEIGDEFEIREIRCLPPLQHNRVGCYRTIPDMMGTTEVAIV